MAAPLTWRDVTAPDFGTALRGIGQAGSNLSQGFNTLGDALGNFQTYRQGEAANTVLNNAAGFSDPAKLRAAIADGTLFGGVDRSLVTPQTLAALNVQPGMLLNQGMEAEKLNQAKTIDPLLVQQQDLLNRHQTIANTFDTAANPKRLTGLDLANNQTAATTAGQLISNQFNQAAMPARLTGLDLANSQTVAGTDQTRTNTAQTQQNMSQGATVFGEGQDSYQADRDAQPLIDQFKRTAVTDDDRQALLASPEFQGLSPMAQSRVQAAISGGTAGSSGSGAPATRAIGSAAGGGAPGTQAGAGADTTFNFVPSPKPVSQMPISDVLNYQKTDLLQKAGGTPVGSYQITADTLNDFAPKVLGAGWQKQGFTSENQDKIAHAIFDARKSGDLSQTWSSLPNLGKGGYENMSWADMRSLISKGETGKDAGQSQADTANEALFNLRNNHDQYGARVGSASLAITSALGQQNANNINLKYPKTQADTDTTTGQVVSTMTGKDSTSAYKDLSPARLTNAIEEIKQRVPGTTSQTAAAILEAHPEGAGFIARNVWSFLGGHSNIPNEDAISAELGSLNTGDAATSVKTNNAALAIQSQIQQAGSDYDAAARDYAKALRNPSLPKSQLDGYKQKVALTQAILEGKLKEHKSDETLNFKPNTPAAGEIAGGKLPPPALTDTPDNAPATRAIKAATGANGKTAFTLDPSYLIDAASRD